MTSIETSISSLQERNISDAFLATQKRAANQAEMTGQDGPVAKKRKVFSFGMSNNAWWKFGDYGKDIIETLANREPHDTSNYQDLPVDVPATIKSETTLAGAGRVVSTDNLGVAQPTAPRVGAPAGVSSVIQALQMRGNLDPAIPTRFNNHPSSLRNATFRPIGVGATPTVGGQRQHQKPSLMQSPETRIANAFFRPEQAYALPSQDFLHQDSLHHDNMEAAGNISVGTDDQIDDDDCSEDSAAIKFRAYQAENWTEKFEELIEFRQIFGHCLVPNAFPENPALAQWVKRQRYQYKLKVEGKRSTMSDERIVALEEVGFVWDSHSAVWDERLQDLMEYNRVNGDCNVPSRYTGNRQLAVWVKRQRRQYKFYCENQPSSMTEERIHRLNAIGFQWDLKNKKTK